VARRADGAGRGARGYQADGPHDHGGAPGRTRPGVDDSVPIFSADSQEIAYQSSGAQTSNPEGDDEVYVMNALDGTGQTNLSNTGGGINDVGPVFSPDGQKIAYLSRGVQTSNPEGDYEIYRMNALDGSGKKNLTNNDVATDESPEWGR
jgi:Tol biopolymer transport system component